MRSLGHVLEFVLHPHNPETCTCDMRPTMALACASPWLREQVLLRGAYSLGPCFFELEKLAEPGVAVSEVGEARWREHQHRYEVQCAAVDPLKTPLGCSSSARGTRVAAHLHRLTIHWHLEEDEDAFTTATEPPRRPPLTAALRWWQPCGWSVQLKGQRCALEEMEAVLEMVQSAWSCPVTGLCVEGYSRPNPEAERQCIARLMRSTADTLRYLEVECLEIPPFSTAAEGAPAPGLDTQGRGEVRRLVLNHCATKLSEVAAWLRNSPLEALFISYDSPFTPTHFHHRAAHVAADEGVTAHPSSHGAGIDGSPSSSASSPSLLPQMTTELTPLTPPTLRHLMLDQTNVTPAHIASIQCRRGLARLSLIDCDQIDGVDLTGMTCLRALLLSRCPLTSMEELVNLHHCQSLVLLNLSGCTQLKDINAVGALPNLKELFAYQVGVTNDGIRGLAQCTALEKLNLGGCQGLTNVSSLGGLTKLKDLHLWGTRVDNNGIAALSGSTALTQLLLDGCTRVSDVTPLAGLPNLRWLSLIETGVTLAGIAALSQCPQLEALAIAGTEIENAPRLWNHDSVLEFLERVVVD